MHINYFLFLYIVAYLCITNTLSKDFFFKFLQLWDLNSILRHQLLC